MNATRFDFALQMYAGNGLKVDGPNSRETRKYIRFQVDCTRWEVMCAAESNAVAERIQWSITIRTVAGKCIP